MLAYPFIRKIPEGYIRYFPNQDRTIEYRFGPPDPTTGKKVFSTFFDYQGKSLAFETSSPLDLSEKDDLLKGDFMVDPNAMIESTFPTYIKNILNNVRGITNASCFFSPRGYCYIFKGGIVTFMALAVSSSNTCIRRMSIANYDQTKDVSTLVNQAYGVVPASNSSMKTLLATVKVQPISKLFVNERSMISTFGGSIMTRMRFSPSKNKAFLAKIDIKKVLPNKTEVFNVNFLCYAYGRNTICLPLSNSMYVVSFPTSLLDVVQTVSDADYDKVAQKLFLLDHMLHAESKEIKLPLLRYLPRDEVVSLIPQKVAKWAETSNGSVLAFENGWTVCGIEEGLVNSIRNDLLTSNVTETTTNVEFANYMEALLHISLQEVCGFYEAVTSCFSEV